MQSVKLMVKFKSALCWMRRQTSSNGLMAADIVRERGSMTVWEKEKRKTFVDKFSLPHHKCAVHLGEGPTAPIAAQYIAACPDLRDTE